MPPINKKKEDIEIEKILNDFFNFFVSHDYQKVLASYLSLINFQKFSKKKILKSLIKFPLIIIFYKILSLSIYFLPKISSTEFICFFPVFHIGGAEKVHSKMIEELKEKNPIVFFTDRSSNNRFKESFYLFSRVVDLKGIPYRNHFLFFIFSKVISSYLNKFNKLVILTSNSPFFYEMVSDIKEDIKIIDIVHAFGGGIELVSFPYVNRINKRIIINNHINNLLEKQYLEEFSEITVARLLKRVVLLENQVMTPLKPIVKDSGTFNIVYAGRDSVEKRVYLITRISSEIKKIFPDIKVTFAGASFREISEKYGDIFNVVGPIFLEEEINKLYDNSHITLITSSSEGFPMMIMEAMSRGVIPISVNVGGISSHIVDGENGFLVDNESDDKIVKSFIEKIQYLKNNKEVLKKISNNAWKYARNNFYQPDYRKKLLKILFE